MSSKSITYLLIIVLGSFALPFLFLKDASSGYEGALLGAIRLLILPILCAIALDPIIYLWKKFVRKKEVRKPFAKGFINEFVENIFAYWIIFTVLMFIFNMKNFL